MRWTSMGSFVALRTAFTTGGPTVRLGTKWPSITSTWTRPAPPRSAAAISSAQRPKSAERMEGAMIMVRSGRGSFRGLAHLEAHRRLAGDPVARGGRLAEHGAGLHARVGAVADLRDLELGPPQRV